MKSWNYALHSERRDPLVLGIELFSRISFDSLYINPIFLQINIYYPRLEYRNIEISKQIYREERETERKMYNYI